MSRIPPIRDAWYLTGPTASGKTEVSVELARLLDAEIVSLDSMAIYRGMDIGTAKPGREARRAVPHHLIDIRDPVETFSVAQYMEEAHRVVADIRRRGRRVLFVGGTPMYLKALLRGLFQGPPADWRFRQAVLEEAERVGGDALFERLRQVDPLSAARLHPHDLRRIVRALEVHHLTGRPISHWQREFEEGRPAEACCVFVLTWPRPVLHQRIECRVEQMFQRGLVEEVRRLLQRFGQLSRTASQAVGYREVIDHLQHGIPLDQTRERTLVRTRRFARHQMTWFRSLSECRFVAREAGDDPVEVARRIAHWGGQV